METFLELFGLRSKEFSKEPKEPWKFLKNHNRWIYADMKLYTKEDQLELQRLLDEEKKVNTLPLNTSYMYFSFPK